jgi:hypothetical protein
MLGMTLSFPTQRRHTSMSIQASEATPKVAKTRWFVEEANTFLGSVQILDRPEVGRAIPD